MSAKAFASTPVYECRYGTQFCACPWGVLGSEGTLQRREMMNILPNPASGQVDNQSSGNLLLYRDFVEALEVHARVLAPVLFPR